MPETFSDWLSIATVIGMVLFGGGGVIAWFKLREDSKKGVRQENRSDSDSLNAKAVAIVEMQFNYLVKPLQSELDSVRNKVEQLQMEVASHKARYDLAIAHIRKLYAWFAAHLPGTDKVPPPPPIELAGDIHH